MLKGIFVCQLIWIIVLLILSFFILFTNAFGQYAFVSFLYTYILLMLGILTLIKHLISKNMTKIKSNQDLLIEKEKLASLGQMIGGIAHNLKTPIFSITGGLEGLTYLINEYDSSIDDPNVSNLDHHEIAKDMMNWIEKIKSHVSYMSNAITTIKGQAVTSHDSQNVIFNITELFKHVSVLMQFELKRNQTFLNIKNNVPDNIQIKGNISSLIQVLNNLISNSIEAYENTNKEKNIDLIANYNESNIIILVQDYGSGIPENVQKKLFKEMITTKGKNGTGLGLFISHSTIRASFKGNLNFKTSNLGTTFTITIPII